MNKIIFTICTLCLSLMLSAQVNYTIKGTVHGMNGKTIYLYAEEGARTVIDSTTINDNLFIFKGSQPKACFASMSSDRIRITFILENGTINASLDDSGKVTGTPTNDILNACNEKLSIFDDEFAALSKQRYELKKDQKDELAAWEKKWNKLLDKNIAVAIECINQNLDNIVGAYLFRMYERGLPDEAFAKILTNASPVMKQHSYTKKAIKHHEILMRTKIGQKFTDFTLKDPDDKEVSLSDYVGKGKYVLLEFWASWCGPCRHGMPHLKSIYEKFQSKGFEIVGVSLDSKKENWVKGIKDLCITWPQMSDLKGWKCEGAKIYDITGIPSTLLIDPNGIIIAKGLMGDTLENKLSELLK